MDKRLVKLLKNTTCYQNNVVLNTYDQVVLKDIIGTIKTNIDKANHTFVMEKKKSNFTQKLEPRNDGCSNTITTVQKDNLIIEPNKIAVASRGRKLVLGWTDAKGNVVNRHPVEIANCVTSAKRDNTQNYVLEPHIIQRSHGFNNGGVYTKSSPTITGSTWHFNNILKHHYRIRKLTEREVFRLMGVHDEDSDKIRSVVSKSQCYKLAGNSIVVDVLEAIFRELLTKHEIPKFKQLELF